MIMQETRKPLWGKGLPEMGTNENDRKLPTSNIESHHFVTLDPLIPGHENESRKLLDITKQQNA
jgi:hypothetical protein